VILALVFSLTVAQKAPIDEITVVAKKRRCDLSVAGRIIADPEFRARLSEWRVGRPVRVLVPASARMTCLAKIMFRLADHGVTQAEFVDQPD
jgi:hypothetical protein